MHRSALLVLSVLSAGSAQVVEQFARNRHDFWTAAIEDQSLLDPFAHDSEFLVLDEILDVMRAADQLDALSPHCAEDMRLLVSAKQGNFSDPEFARYVWLPVRDSTGRQGAAVLKGHYYFAGHYAECVQIKMELTGRERPFAADYFKVSVDLRFRANFENGSCVTSEDGNYVLAWSFGVCLPASCSSAELQTALLADSAKHNPICRVERTNDSIDDLDAGFYIVLTIMGAIVAVCILSGIADFFLSEYLSDRPVSTSLAWRLFMAFSMYSNIASIFDTSDSKKHGQIAPFHCIRFFSMCWMVIGHLTTTYLGAVTNALDIFALFDDLTTEFVLNTYFCVDSFFFVGGVLLTFLWFKNYYRQPQTTNALSSWVLMYVHRLLRLSPPYYAILIFFTYVWKQMYRNSPVNLSPIINLDACKENWWIELTYLQNVIDGNKCLGYDWYLATDMQIFFFTPLLILPLAYKPLYGFIVAAILFTISTAVNVFFILYYHWPATLPFVGAKDPLETNSEKYSKYIYSSPITRCQVYIIGMLVGWLLVTKKRMRINPVLNGFLWLLSFVVMFTVVLGLHPQTTGTLIPVFWRAMYSAFSKPAWALALSWITVSCFYGYGGPVNAFMAWHVWLPLGRLSYCAYLLHDPILFLVLVQTHDEVYFSSFVDYIITRFFPIIFLVLIASIFWSACFELSFGRAEALLIGGWRAKIRAKPTPGTPPHTNEGKPNTLRL